MTSQQLQHDPKTKSQIKNILYEHLYKPLLDQFQDRINRIIVKNTLIGGFTHKSFMYKNTTYNCDTDALPRKMNRLMPPLYQEMNDYLKDLKQLNEKELPYVMGYINQVLNSSNELHDYLRLFPEAVHGPISALISTCPCRVQKLPEDTVQLLQDKNQSAIQLMRERMVTNLLM